MLRKIIILGLCLSAMLSAMGDKPKTESSSGSTSTVAAPAKSQSLLNQPIEELSADKLYQRAIAEHKRAESINYPEQTDKAIAAAALFVSKYAEDKRRFEMIYYLALNYAKNSKLQERKKVVDDFFAQVPMDDESQKDLIELMRLELLPALTYSGETASANALYAELKKQYADNKMILARLHQDALAILNTDGQKAVYRFFREGNNRTYLNNSSNYYIYTHKLAVIYYNENNYREATPLFKEVAAREEPEYSFFAESATNYLKRISGGK